MSGTTEILISADSHVFEPPDLWAKRLPAAEKDSAPRYPERVKGGLFQQHEGGWNPELRTKEMAADGVSAEVLYPSLAMDQFGLTDESLQEACFRVYNDWLVEYCAHAPDRLFGIAVISTFNIENAIDELGRCRRNGLRGAMIWQVPPADLSFAGKHYDRFWAAAQDLKMPVNLHILTGAPYGPGALAGQLNRPQATQGLDNAVNKKLYYAAKSLTDIVASGVLERYPRLKIVIVENEVSWLPFVVQQLDKYSARKTYESTLTLLPGEYVERQVYATFFNDPPARRLLDLPCMTNCMWSNDFPHHNSTWPDSRAVIARDLGELPGELRARLLHGNVSRLYDLPALLPLNLQQNNPT